MQTSKVVNQFSYRAKDGIVKYCLELENNDIIVRTDEKIFYIVGIGDKLEYTALGRSKDPQYKHWLHQSAIFTINGRPAKEEQSKMSNFI